METLRGIVRVDGRTPCDSGIAWGHTPDLECIMMTAATKPETEDAKAAYFGLGVHYYVVARYAAFAQLVPVCGNLFHHAIEMFLKGYLAHHGEAELKKLGHQLTVLWREFKYEVGDAALDPFDTVVKELDSST